jgi:hypothetical protein
VQVQELGVSILGKRTDIALMRTFYNNVLFYTILLLFNMCAGPICKIVINNVIMCFEWGSDLSCWVLNTRYDPNDNSFCVIETIYRSAVINRVYTVIQLFQSSGRNRILFLKESKRKCEKLLESTRKIKVDLPFPGWFDFHSTHLLYLPLHPCNLQVIFLTSN